MNVWAYSLLSVFIISLISLIGALTLALKEKILSVLLVFLVSFAAGGLLGDVFIHLLPEMVEESLFTMTSSLSIISGILMFFILEKFIAWRHCHIPTSKNHPHPVAFMNLIGDGIHNLIDGAIIAGSFLVSIPLGMATTIAVLFHEVPQEIGDFGVLIHGGFTKRRALFFNFASSLAAFGGAVFVLIFGSQMTDLTNVLVPFTAGGFIYIAGSDLIPELHKETKPIKSVIQLAGLLFGIAIMFGLKLFG